MSILNNSLLLGAPAGAATYSIPRSLRFNSSDSAYLSRTPASAGNRKTWTWAGWVKRSRLGVQQDIFSAGPLSSSGNATGLVYLEFGDGDQLVLIAWTGSGSNVQLVPSAVFRDASAWYHVVAVMDTTNATSSERMRLYVNGIRITNFSTATYPTQNTDFSVNNTQAHALGRYVWGQNLYLSALLADIHLIDGQALTPSSFGEFDSNGIWQPKAYTGTYGTNGFHLDFADNSAATATTLGKDTSGNGNNWTPNNLSVTAGAGNDSLVDSPTNGTASSGGDAGGVVVGNYATFNLLSAQSATLTNGNLDCSITAGGGSAVATIAVSTGKWYWEVTPTSGSAFIFGISDATAAPGSRTHTSANGWGYYSSNGQKYNNNLGATYGATYTSNDVIGIALDLDNGTLTFYKNGASQGTAYTSLTGKTYYPALFEGTGAGGQSYVANFGSRSFAYTAPAGFRSLNTANLPTPTILKGSDYFQTLLITGANQAYTGLNFSPDFLWFKRRDNIEFHYLFDAVRGGAALLRSNLTDAESTGTTYISAFGSTGFTTTNNILTNSASYAAWCWDAGSSNSTNTQGSITSTVRANASAGFSAVTFTKAGGSSTAETIGHGLNATPYLIITKARNLTEPWYTYHNSLGNNGRVQLNETSAATIGTSVWGTTSPTSQVFTMQGVYNADYVAYCFAPVAGYSAMGSYIGNGSADGPFVYTGHRSRWIMIKKSSNTGSWIIWDSARDTYNYFQYKLAANLSSSENDPATIGYAYQETLDATSNGFKLRSTNQFTNTNGETYIYASFSENPFSIARAR